MKLVKKVLAALMAGAVIPLAAHAQAFPEKGSTLRIIVPFAPGGGVDNAARLLAEQLRKQLGTTIVVENKAGASGTLGGKAVQTAPADGYTMLFSAATHVLAKQVLAAPPYDPQTDFVPVARVGEAPLMLVIAPALEPRTLAQMIGAAKAKPDEWMAAIPAAGAPSHLATLLFAKQAGLKLTYVPYKGTQPAPCRRRRQPREPSAGLHGVTPAAGEVREGAASGHHCGEAQSVGSGRADDARGRTEDLQVRVLVRRMGAEGDTGRPGGQAERARHAGLGRAGAQRGLLGDRHRCAVRGQ